MKRTDDAGLKVSSEDWEWCFEVCKAALRKGLKKDDMRMMSRVGFHCKTELGLVAPKVISTD